MTQALPRYVVGIDIETTGLNPMEADIIEVAAVRFDTTTGAEVNRLVYLTKPLYPINETVQSLTGITPDMVATAPAFKDIGHKVADFIGTDTVFAHNAPFDINFLAVHGVKLTNLVWDTFVLSSVAWPEAPSYNLATLSLSLEISLPGEHRAAHDIAVTWQLLEKIRKKLIVPLVCQDALGPLLTKTNQLHYWPLFTFSAAFTAPETPQPPASANQPPPALKKSQNILGENGFLQKHLPGFSPRPEQIKMAQEIEYLIEHKTAGLIEAGTGTGKTYAYLVPALLRCKQGERVIISTYTRHLQDQLTHTDIPRLLQALNLQIPYGLLKGRRNYICGTRLSQLLRRGVTNPHDAWMLIKITLWLAQGGSGDLDQINLSHQSLALIHQVSAASPFCTSACGQPCPYQKARGKAQQASLLVVNHALLIQIFTTDQEPRPPVVIIDEAHHLIDAAREASRRDLSASFVVEILETLRTTLKNKKTAQLRQHLTSLSRLFIELQHDIGVKIEQIAPRGRFHLTTTTRRSSSWQKILSHGQAWHSSLTLVLGLLSGINDAEYTPDNQRVLRESRHDLENFAHEWWEFLQGSGERIQWIDTKDTPQGKMALCQDETLDIRSLTMPIFTKSSSVCLTSAGLTIGGEFSYIKKRIGLTQSRDTALPSSFNYQKNMLIYIVDDGPAPPDSGFDTSTAHIIHELAVLLRGKILVLQTSHKAVMSLYDKLIPVLNKAKIRIMAQRISGGRHALLERFRRGENSVLLGTNSFWEGIDIPGDALSCLVIPRLPFTPPDDPLTVALQSRTEVDVFNRVSIPQMILRLRQGIGRLLRTTSDRGIVVLLDSRFLHSDYGSAVLKSLPPATIRIGSRRELIESVRQWFGEKTITRWRTDYESG